MGSKEKENENENDKVLSMTLMVFMVLNIMFLFKNLTVVFTCGDITMIIHLMVCIIHVGFIHLFSELLNECIKG